jgi:hypothetical protein
MHEPVDYEHLVDQQWMTKLALREFAMRLGYSNENPFSPWFTLLDLDKSSKDFDEIFRIVNSYLVGTTEEDRNLERLINLLKIERQDSRDDSSFYYKILFGLAQNYLPKLAPLLEGYTYTDFKKSAY